MTLEEARAAIAALARRVEPRPGEVRLELEGAVARLVLDNPGVRNALTLQMMLQLLDAVEALERWDGALLLLSHSGPVFCAGGHLGQVRRAVSDPEAARTMAEAMTAVLDGLLDLPVISISALDGPAIGGGAEICTATDFRALGPNGAIHFVHGRLGIAPGWGGTGRLVAHVGARTALRVLAEAAAIEGSAARDVGLADAVGPSAQEAAETLLEPMRSQPATALRALKRQVAGARRGDPGAEAEAFAEVWGGPDHRAALARLRAAR